MNENVGRESAGVQENGVEGKLQLVYERFDVSVMHVMALHHFHRYLAASPVCAGKDVLDAACGTGYGSALLARTARTVTGVDIDGATIEACRTNYCHRHENLSFLQGDVAGIPLQDASVDVVISFETIEHVDAPRQIEFLREIRRVLRPGGLLVMSSPNKDDAHANEFHVHELEECEFRNLLKQQFGRCAYFRQKIVLSSFIRPHDADGDDRAALYGIMARDGQPTEPCEPDIESKYVIALASDGEIPALSSSVNLDVGGAILEAFIRQNVVRSTSALRTTIDELRTAARITHQRLVAQNERETRLRDEIAKRKLREESLHDGIARHQARAEALRGTVDACKATETRLRAALEADKEREARLRDEVAKRKSREESLQDGIARHQARAESLQDGIARHQARAEALRGTVDACKATEARLRAALEADKERETRLRDEIAKRKLREESLHDGIARHQARAEALRGTVDACKATETRLRAALEADKEREARLRDEVAKRKSREESLQDGIARHQARAESLQDGIARHQARAEALRGTVAACRATEARLRAEVEAGKGREKDLSDELARKKAQASALQKRIVLFRPYSFSQEERRRLRRLAFLHPIRCRHLVAEMRLIASSPLFDVEYYCQNNAEAAETPLLHFCQQGWRSGRNPSALFDINDYLNGDQTCGPHENPLAHFLQREGERRG